MGLRYDSARRTANREKSAQKRAARATKKAHDEIDGKTKKGGSLSYHGERRTANRAKSNEKRQTRIKKEIKRINEGGATRFKSKEDSLSSLKGKLKNVKSKSKSESSSSKRRDALLIKARSKGRPGTSVGARKSQAAAKAMIDAGLNTRTGKLKGTKKKRKVTTWRDME